MLKNRDVEYVKEVGLQLWRVNKTPLTHSSKSNEAKNKTGIEWAHSRVSQSKHD